uniref:NADH-ubiquinone oxidoreductase chain 3 n=1 Tax=Lachesilla anna TaxID=239245 RepID=A0A343QCG8_9NEOP|nr:NADH dehydrogenase subunit 3 [Lachesilla anna]ATU07115.1 NADH dehydrogenase subunit 3 [Lachesilla anna]
MINIILMFTFIFVITNLLMTACLILSKKTFNDREKLSPFECGFDQKSSSRYPFSLRFFLIAIIFLIFDVEITLILPSIVNLNFCDPYTWLKINLIFIVILIIGILHEWNQGAIEWSN